MSNEITQPPIVARIGLSQYDVLSEKYIATLYANPLGTTKPISEPMKKQDANPYITPITLDMIMFLLKLMIIAPAQTVTGIIMAASSKKPTLTVKSSKENI